jgi:hypothetical protein
MAGERLSRHPRCVCTISLDDIATHPDTGPRSLDDKDTEVRDKGELDVCTEERAHEGSTAKSEEPVASVEPTSIRELVRG